MKKLVLLFTLLAILLAASDPASGQKRSTYGGYKSKSGTSSYKPLKPYTPSKQTYDIGGTKYKYGETYKSTGLPKVERSAAVKRDFLQSRGYDRVPDGFEVDHVVPLSKGGADQPSNMQLIPKAVHKQKTASERRRK